MNINTLLTQKGVTKYRLAKTSGVPQTTVIDICSGKSKIKNCSGETIYKLAKALGVTMESLVADCLEYRPVFETFKSSVYENLYKQSRADEKGAKGLLVEFEE